MKTIYILYIITYLNGSPNVQTQQFYSDVGCQQAAAQLINTDIKAYCVKDSSFDD